jgi:hypothetical protein
MIMQAIQVSDTGRSLWHQTFFLLCNIGLETKVIKSQNKQFYLQLTRSYQSYFVVKRTNCEENNKYLKISKE